MVTLLLLLISSAFAKLELVMEVARHGSRTPLTLLPWSVREEPGTVVAQGQQQQAEIGAYIKKHYLPLLTTDPAEDVYVRAAIPQRTLNSARAQAAALLDSEIEVDTVVSESDYMLRPHHACPRIQYLMQRDRFSTKFYTGVIERAQEHAEEIQRLAGEEWDFMSLYTIGDTVLSYNDRDIPLPVAISEEVQELCIEAYHRYNDKLLFGSKEQGKLATYPLVHQLAAYIEQVVENKVQHRVGIYVTHDSVLIAFLHMLGFQISPIAPSSVLFIEIHSGPEGVYLNFIFNYEPLESSECGYDCPADEYLEKLLGRAFKTEKTWMKACSTVDDPPPSFWKKFVMPALVAFGLFMFFKMNTQGAIWLVNRFRKPHAE